MGSGDEMLEESFLVDLRTYVQQSRLAQPLAAMDAPSHWPKHAGIGPVVMRRTEPSDESSDAHPSDIEGAAEDFAAPCVSDDGDAAGSGLRNYVDSERLSPFSEEVLDVIDGSGLTDVEVYRRAGMDRKHFSKLRSANYHPGKPTVVALCLALRLGHDEAASLLASAGYALSRSDTGDLVIRYCIDHGVYGLMDVNEALTSMGAEPLPVRSLG